MVKKKKNRKNLPELGIKPRRRRDKHSNLSCPFPHTSGSSGWHPRGVCWPLSGGLQEARGALPLRDAGSWRCGGCASPVPQPQLCTEPSLGRAVQSPAPHLGTSCSRAPCSRHTSVCLLQLLPMKEDTSPCAGSALEASVSDEALVIKEQKAQPRIPVPHGWC